MATLIARNAEMLLTMDSNRREIAGGGLFARDGVIEQVGPSTELPTKADLVLDLGGHIVLPGLVNTPPDKTRPCLDGCKPSIRSGPVSLRRPYMCLR